MSEQNIKSCQVHGENIQTCLSNQQEVLRDMELRLELLKDCQRNLRNRIGLLSIGMRDLQEIHQNLQDIMLRE